MSTNYLTQFSANLSTISVANINYSTLIGSTIIASSIITNSIINVSSITSRTINYSTLIGSTLIAQAVNYSTLTGSTISANTISIASMITTSSILATGNIGIGTNAPGAKLDVNGIINSIGGFVVNTAYPSTNGVLRLISDSGGNYIQSGLSTASDSKAPLIFGSIFNGTEWMRITAAGNVGIGTNNPGAKLDVNGGATINGNLTVSNSNVSISGIGLGTATTDNIFFNVSAPDSSNGDGGRIVYSNSIRLKAGDLVWTGNRQYGAQIYIGGGYSRYAAASQSYMEFSTAGGVRMKINESGYVGIGTNSPEYPLDVYGGTRLMSNVTDTSVSSTTNSLTIVRYNAPGSWSNYGGMLMFSNTYASNSSGIIATGGISGYQTTNGSFGGGLTFWYALGGTLTVGMSLSGSGNVSIAGSLSKGSGTFDIEHPLYPNTNKRLVHSFIEGPRCDLIYRGTVALTNGSATVYIDKQCTYTQEDAMDNGTFEALCANPQYFLQNMSGFNRVVGSIYRGILTITSEDNTATDMISWMVVAERKDPFIKNWNRTDSNGYLNTQYTKDN